VDGALITVEGLDGTGKTTLCAQLAPGLRARGMQLLALREPGGTIVGERVRAVLADPAMTIDPVAEALLFAAARRQLVAEVVRPALKRGYWVLLDRFADSTLAYQGAGRQLGDELAGELARIATGGLVPDRTLLLQATDAERVTRIRDRGDGDDRLELADAASFRRIDARYRQLAADEPGRVRVINASGPIEDVLAAAYDAIADLLPERAR